MMMFLRGLSNRCGSEAQFLGRRLASTRNSENEDFKAALKDDLDAVSLIASAIDALAAFYKNNKLPLNLAQTEKKHEKKHDKKHHGKQDPDKMPETFSEPYGGAASQGGGIVSIMGYIKEDLENEIKQSKAAEAAAQSEFDAERSAAMKSIEALNAKKTTLEQQAADLGEKITDQTEEKQGKGVVKGNKQQYREDLKSKCDWMKDNFDTRRTARQEEMTAMLRAKSSLAGGEGDREEETLAQKGSFLKKREA